MLDFWLYVFVTAGIYTIFALGLMIQFGIAGLPNFGNGAFMAVSSYTMAITVIKLGLPLPLAAILAILAAVLFGAILALPTLRLRADYLAIATIAAGEIIRYLAINLQGLTGGTAGTVNILGPGVAADYNSSWTRMIVSIRNALQHVIGFKPSSDMVMIGLVWPTALLLVAATWYMVQSPWGRTLRAIREDEEAASALGKAVFMFKLQAFLIGAAIAGVAGLFFAWEVSTFTPMDFMPILTFYAFVVVLVGGKTNILAIPVGAILFSFTYAGTRFLDVWPLSFFDSTDRAFLRQVLVGIALIALVILRPQGIFGNKREDAFDK